MKWGMEPFLVLNRTISSKSVVLTKVLNLSKVSQMVQNYMFFLNMEKEYIYIQSRLVFKIHCGKKAKANMSHLDDSSLSCA